MDFYNTPLAQIAQTIPGASAVLNQYELNFCCGGQHTLLEASKKANLDAKEVNQAINNLLPKEDSSKDWKTVSNKELIEHILERFHAVHREQLNELIRFG